MHEACFPSTFCPTQAIWLNGYKKREIVKMPLKWKISSCAPLESQIQHALD